MISGAVAGLGTITPASGFVLPWQGIVIGLVAGAICFWACTKLKQKLGYDDSLDVFGVHGVGGTTGTLLCGVFAVAAVGETAGLLEGNPSQLLYQVYGIAAVAAWSGVGTAILLKVIEFMVPLRVSKQSEIEGLDVTQHGEALQKDQFLWQRRRLPCASRSGCDGQMRASFAGRRPKRMQQPREYADLSVIGASHGRSLAAHAR